MDFSQLNTWQRFEELCKVLLNLEYQNIYGVVPSRGDRGIDSFSLNIILDGRLQVFQFKFFNGKLTPGHKQQIKNSLKRAIQQNPVSWHLMTPAEFTFEDWKWWKSLQAEYDTVDLQIWSHDKLEALVITHQENLKMEFTELFSHVGIALELGKTVYENILNDLKSHRLREANIVFLSVYTPIKDGDINCWKKGHFRMEDVHAGYDAKRDAIRTAKLIKSSDDVNWLINVQMKYGKKPN